MIAGALVLPEVMVGMIEASATATLTCRVLSILVSQLPAYPCPFYRYLSDDKWLWQYFAPIQAAGRNHLLFARRKIRLIISFTGAVLQIFTRNTDAFYQRVAIGSCSQIIPGKYG